jgi:hypothetical protein
MPATPPPSLSPLPAAPDRADRVTFSSRATAMFAALKDVFVGQVNAIASNVYGNAQSAESAATAAGTSATAAATSATSAGTSATSAGSSATNAAASATSAGSSATNAAASASSASASAAAAAASAATAAGVTTVNGRSGTVTLTKSDVGLGSVDNVPAASLRDRATHTGVQAISTVSGLQTALDGLAASSGGAAFKNRIINGKMEISQRNGSAAMALTATATYFNDRWCCVSSTTPSGTLVTGRTTIAGALGASQLGDGFANCLYFQRQSGSYAGFARAIQVLETTESLSLAGRTVTLSFWAAINSGWLGGNITASVVTGTGTDQSSTQFLAGTASGQATAGTTTITPTTTLTRYSVQATIPAGATQAAVILQNAGWSGSGTSSDIIAITGVQLEIGSVATPFEHRPAGVELALCQRYCEVSKTAILRNQFNTGFTYQWFTFAVQKRVIPTFFLQNTSYTNGAGGAGNAASLTGLELAFNASSAGGFISTDLVSVAEL